ncbi:hypothetical protein BS17DRAFT_816070 [Gyrodon lividus]|nr:hypothetical protein BS17DRAFT_816070 [Gyrodon lividus]
MLEDNDNTNDDNGSNKANDHGWEVATWEFEEFADAEELEWEEQFVRMDQQLSQAHKDHKALMASLSAFEERGQQTSQAIAEAKWTLGSLENHQQPSTTTSTKMLP